VFLPVYPDLAARHACRQASLAVPVPPVCRAYLVGLPAQLVLQQLRCSPRRSTHAHCRRSWERRGSAYLGELM